MEFIVDHDLHIHSNLSTCSRSPEQTPERIARYAVEMGLKTICLTDHFWDERVPGASAWYEKQNYPHICSSKPLPQPEGVRFLFGCETDLDQHLTLGISRERMDAMDFIIIATTHFHMKFALTEQEQASVAGRTGAWLRRLDGVLSMDLPFRKVGLAHLSCPLIHKEREQYLQILADLPEADLTDLFKRAARCGVGIELNASDIVSAEGAEDIVLRPFRIAKDCGCKFYCGSDAHKPEDFLPKQNVFHRAVELLNLTEEDKFTI